MQSTEESLARGRASIQRYIAELPDAPGVYRMIDEGGVALYIGKAKNLKHRVASYINVGAMGNRLQRMVAQTVAMEFTITRSEAEALLLEANLVKKLEPRYNILLKDDKSFPYILLSGDHDFPRIAKHRGAKTKKGKYFGPFVSGHAVNETITLLQKAFLIRPCADSVFKNRTRPCLQYQIKRCSAPCVNKISKGDYGKLVAQAQDFLSGKSRQIQDELVTQMQEMSLKMDYEKASVIRDRIKALTQVQQEQGLAMPSVGDADVIALYRDRQQCAVQIFSIRGGRNYGGKSYFPAHTTQAGDSEILESFIGQFYQAQAAPGLILVSHLLEGVNVLEEALSLNAGSRIDVVYPLRGDKRELIEQAMRNAKEALTRHLALRVTEREILAGVQKLFGLEDMPERIEVYDNSHISGTHAVGAMIVAGPEGFIKTAYRKFNIRSVNPHPDLLPEREKMLNSPTPFQGEGRGEGVKGGDDYAMLREVLTRRFSKIAGGEEQNIPSLVLLDGGAGQAGVAARVFEELGLSDIVFAGIAKGPDRHAGREHFFIPGREPFQLPENDPVLYYLQRLRDEAHRFAIGAHRKRRAMAIKTSELDAIPLIGPGRKRALLHHFGSAKAVSSASIDELEKVIGISRSMARQIYEYYHGEE